MAGPVRTDYCGKLSDPTAIRLCNDVADTCDAIFADAVGAELDERPFVLTLEGGGSTHGEGKASCYQRARSLGSLGRKVIPQGKLQAPPQPKGPVVPMREDDVRAGFCTERTGFIPTPRARLENDGSGHKLIVDGEEVAGAGDPVPILDNRPGEIGRRSRMLLLPSRDLHFKKNKAVPVDRTAFDGTIDRMIDDISSVISGPFARVCGLDYLKEFSGDLVLYVLGKTDRLGSGSHNRKLSNKRARAVSEAIAAKRKNIAGSLWAGSQRGLRIEYIGVGESMTDTEDGVSSPQDRRVELYLSTDGPPLAGEWASAAGPGGLAADPSDPLAYYCGGADSDCGAAIAQCESALSVMCEEAYPFSYIDRNRCAAETGAWMASGEVGDSEVKKWLEKGYFRFPIMYDQKIEFADTLRHCLRRAPAVAQSHYVSSDSPSRIFGSTVSDPKAVRGTIPSGTNYCTVEHGWMESSRTTITETPRGEMLWYKGLPVTTFGSQLMVVNKRGDKTMVAPTYEVDLDGDNVVEAASKVTSDLVDWIFEGDFTKKCLWGKVSRVLVIDFYADSIDEKVQRKMKEVIEVVQAKLMEYRDRFPRGVKFMMRFNLLNSHGKYRGLFVTPSLPFDLGFIKQQGTYKQKTKKWDDGAIEVIPLR